jgi:hypothetical protein
MDCKAIAAAGALRAAGLAPSRRDSRVSQDTRVSSSTQLGVGSAKDSARQLAQEFLLVHAVLEGFAAVDKHDWHFVVKLPPQFVSLSTSTSCHVKPPRRDSLVRLSFTTSQR